MKAEDWKDFVTYASKTDEKCKWHGKCLCKHIFRLVDEGCLKCAEEWLKDNPSDK